MADSDEETDTLQAGKQTLSPPPLLLRAHEQSDSDEGLPELSDVSAAAEEESSAFRDSVVSALTSVATMSFFSSAFFHLVIWITAILLLPVIGFNWLEFSSVEEKPISASLGDDEILDDTPKFNVIGSLDVEVDEPSSSMQELAQHLQESESAWLKSVNEEVFNPSSIESDGEGEVSGGVLLKVPEEGLAVTKGSFTAFTIPAQPEPLKPYRIVIEVRLPGDVKKYRINDLKGEVIGTDGYQQFLPYDKRVPSASRTPTANGKEAAITSSTAIDVIRNRVQIIIAVPGARNLVKDRIKIRSRRLREDHELTLTFARPKTQEEDTQEKGTQEKQ